MDIIEVKRSFLYSNFLTKIGAISEKHKHQYDRHCPGCEPEWLFQKSLFYQRENFADVKTFDHINKVSTINILKPIITDYLRIQNDTHKNSSDPAKIIHLYIFTSDGRVVLIKRSCGRWAPVSGEMEKGENCERTAFREIKEETGLIVYHIYVTDHTFKGTSPKGKKIFGTTCFTILPKSFSSSDFKFNHEIVGSVLLSKNDALSLLVNKGFQESAESFQYILNHNLNRIRFK